MTFLAKVGASLWFKIALGVVVGGAVLATILVFAIPGILNGEDASGEKEPFSLEDFLQQKFACYGWNGTWHANSTFLYQNMYGDIYLYDLSIQNSTGFLPGFFLAQYPDAATLVSSDTNYVLIRYNESSVFRHSVTARYDLLDINQKVLYRVHNGSFVQFAKFDSTGHGFAYVHNNSLYYVAGPSSINTPTLVAQGEKNKIYCGVPDWVYEEEVSGTDSAIWFSPDGKRIAYAVYNDTNVTDFSYFIYGQPGNLEDQYPTLTTIKYPKVGTPNPLVETFVFDLETGQNTRFVLPSSMNQALSINDYILYDLTWVTDSQIAMISTNRVQNESVIVRCKMTGNCEEEVTFKQYNGWLKPKIPHYFTESNGVSLFKIEILPQPEGDDYYEHLVMTSFSVNTSLRLTYGKRIVNDFYGYDQNKSVVYYAASLNNTPSQQHVFSADLNRGIDTCLTCNWTVDGQDCKYARASFSKDLKYYAASCSGPQPHYVSIRSVTNHSEVLLWQNNPRVRNALQIKQTPKIVDLEVPVANGTFTARARMFLPPNMDESKKYPAIVNVYGGPESNLVMDTYSGNSILNHFVTNRSYIYIYIDGRGSDRDGHNKMFQVYRKMGTVEIEDQINVTKYLQNSYSYIDANRTGIWGWSYGGFASTWALIKDTQKVFKFALAVAPVTSFIYYDSIYTERYMGLPTENDNLAGYNNTDITRNVEAMRNRNYFIIHGNADDNVHYQQSMALVRALEISDIDFTQVSYPDENHSLNGVGPHLYHTLDKFFRLMFEN